MKQFSLLKKKHRHLKVVLSIGGPNQEIAANFGALSASAVGRANFVETSVAALKTNGFDGLDVYWKWPRNATEASNYTKLLDEIRTGLDIYSSEQGSRHLSLSVACPVGPEQYTLLDLRSMDKYVDFWNLVAHDFAGDSISSVSAHQANMFTGDKELSTPYNPAQAVSDLLDNDIAPEKILLGLPLYGRGFANTDGLGQSFFGSPPGDFKKGIRDYKNLPPPGADVRFDPAANAAYSYDEKKKELFSFDNPDSVSKKSNFIQTQELGGAMFWEASGDRRDEGSLTTLVSSLVSCLIGILADNSHTQMARGLGGEDLAGLDRSENTIEYPESKFVNIRGVEA